MFSNSSIGILLFITHLLSAITVGIFLGLISRITPKRKNIDIPKYSHAKQHKTIPCTFNNLGFLLSEAILDSSKTIIMIGGFVVIFSVIISILSTSRILQILSYALYPILNFTGIHLSLSTPIISGIIELTNGVSMVASLVSKNISINIVVCAFLIGFGGISVLLQVLSIISKSDMSIKKYFYGKILQGIIAASYTYILINTLPFFNLNL